MLALRLFYTPSLLRTLELDVGEYAQRDAEILAVLATPPTPVATASAEQRMPDLRPSAARAPRAGA